jgi:hypothetical protein
MKKLPLAIAALSLFSASSIFAEQYFNQDFKVSLDIPSNIDVSAFKQDVVKLNMDDLNKKEGALIGVMNIKTSASSCYAEIKSDNDFNLVGPSGKLPYTIDYIGTTKYGNQISTQFSVKNNLKKQKVGCNNGGDLKMNLSGAGTGDIKDSNGNMLSGAYNDVIHVAVTTNL